MLLEGWYDISTRVPNNRLPLYLPHVETDGTQLYTLIENAGLEGIVAKRADAPYRAGRTSAWLKVKTPAGRARESTRFEH